MIRSAFAINRIHQIITILWNSMKWKKKLYQVSRYLAFRKLLKETSMPIIFDSSLSREYLWEQNSDKQKPKCCNTEAELHRAWTRRNTDTVWGRWSPWNSGPAWAPKTSIILIKISLCDAAKLSSFTFLIAVPASSTHKVEQVVLEKVRVPLRFKSLHQIVRRL